MSDFEYGYLGNAPTQSKTNNTGVFSADDVYDLKSNDKWTLSIPKENLIQHLEKRFWTSGSTWYDQSGNGYNATLNGTIRDTNLFDSTYGEFQFNFSQTSDWLNLNATALRQISSSSAWSFAFVTYASFNSTYGLSIASPSTDNEFIIGNATNEYRAWRNPTSNASESSRYQFVVLYYNGSNVKVYNSYNASTHTIGGSQNNITNATGFVLNQEQDSVLGGFQSSQASYWNISAFTVYDEVLSSAKITELEKYFKQYYSIESTL